MPRHVRSLKKNLSGAQFNPVEDKSNKPETKTNNQEQVEHVTTLTKEQKRLLSRQCGETREQGSETEVSKHPLEISAAALKELQDRDRSLARIREAADGQPNSAGVGFFQRKGLLYRKWTPPGRGEESEVEQLVLQQGSQKAVLELGHEITLAGHIGKEKTRQRILRQFYWPTLYKDVKEFCLTCVTCQK